MVSEIEQLEQDLAAAKARLKNSKDIAYCGVDKIRAFASNMEKMLSLRPGEEDTLERRLENIVDATRKLRNDYTSALWSDRDRNRC